MRKRNKRVTAPKSGKSVTQQQFKKDADINTIADRHFKGAGRFGAQIGNPAATRKPRFMDISSIEFHSMLNKVVDTQEAFRSLSARTKGRFNNDPYQLLRFVENPDNRAQALEMGLILPTEDEIMSAHQAAMNPQPDPNQQTPLRSDDEANPRLAPKTPNEPKGS